MFEFDVDDPGRTVFIGPLVAVGYYYHVQGGPSVRSVLLPSVGDDLFDIYG